MYPILQNRWQIEGQTLKYYGLRNKPNTFKTRLWINDREKELLQQMDGTRHLEDFSCTRRMKKWIKQGIIVDVKDYIKLKNSWDEASFCKRCVANDFMIPGLELDEEGLCPICSNHERFKNYTHILPKVSTLPRSSRSAFDVALFYTGGKDSSYLLYYLSKVLKLRVVALTWEIPFMSLSAVQSIEKAKAYLPDVTFISKRIDAKDLSKVYKKLYTLQGNTCACPSLAYVLFYPLMVEEKIPYLIVGNEPAQVKGLLFNQMAPAFTYKWGQHIHHLINIGRLLTCHKPFKAGQFQMYMSIRQLVSPIKSILGYENHLVNHVCEALQEVPHLLEPLKQALKVSSRSGNIPAFVHIDLNEISKDRTYRWDEIKEMLQEEIGWVDVEETSKGLHTSCKVEQGKEYSQFIRFRQMKTQMIPFSALELSIAVGMGNVDREKALEELKSSSGFVLEEPEALRLMERACKL